MMLLSAADLVSDVTTFVLSLAGLEKETIKALLDEWRLIYVWDVTRDKIATIPILIGLPAALLLEKLLGRRRRRIFTPDFWQNVWCKVLNVLILSTVVAGILGLIHNAYDAYLPFLQVRILDGAALWAQFLAAFVIGDFLNYVQHWIRHRVPVMWAFHAMHHSDPHPTPGTGLREHIGDPVAGALLNTGPVMVLGADPIITFWLVLAYQCWSFLTHMDAPVTYGVLGRFTVSPSFHRIHHSAESRHWDKNFGEVLTIWDRMFGTACFDYDGPFTCGIADYAGATPTSGGFRDQWKTWAWLTLRPVRDIAKGAWRSRSGSVYGS